MTTLARRLASDEIKASYSICTPHLQGLVSRFTQGLFAKTAETP
jgi:hypothetical protein